MSPTGNKRKTYKTSSKSYKAVFLNKHGINMPYASYSEFLNSLTTGVHASLLNLWSKNKSQQQTQPALITPGPGFQPGQKMVGGERYNHLVPQGLSHGHLLTSYVTHSARSTEQCPTHLVCYYSKDKSSIRLTVKERPVIAVIAVISGFTCKRGDRVNSALY